MGRYFKVIDKNRTDGRIDYIDNDGQSGYAGSEMYDAIEEVVGDMECPSSGVPYPIEVDGWCDLACEGDTYKADEFDIECITEEEYNEWQIPNY